MLCVFMLHRVAAPRDLACRCQNDSGNHDRFLAQRSTCGQVVPVSEGGQPGVGSLQHRARQDRFAIAKDELPAHCSLHAAKAFPDAIARMRSLDGREPASAALIRLKFGLLITMVVCVCVRGVS